MPTIDIEAALLGKTSEPPWIIQKVLPQGHLVVLAGDAGVGKSFLCYVMAIAVASGIPFLGYPTEQQRVLYFDEENAGIDHVEYLQQAWRGLDCPPIGPLVEHLRFEHFSLHNWNEQIREMVLSYQPGLMCVDTVNPALNIMDENDNNEAGRAVQALRRIQGLSPGLSIMLIKHARFMDDHSRRTIRGAKVWLGAADAAYYHVNVPGRPRASRLRRTQIIPDKVRAFGLGGNLMIDPEVIDRGGKGVKLNNISPAEA